MFNNNYDRNRINKFNNFNESPDNKLKYKIDNNFDLKQQSKNKFFGNLNLFNQSHSNDIINRKLPEQNSPYNKNSFIGKTENKSREINYNDYSKFYKEANNQAYPINNNKLKYKQSSKILIIIILVTKIHLDTMI